MHAFLVHGPLIVHALFFPELGKRDRRPSMTAPAFFGCAGLVLGFYDGFCGPGTGSWAIVW